MNKLIYLIGLIIFLLISSDAFAHASIKHDFGMVDGLIHMLSQHGHFLLILFAVLLVYLARFRATE